MTGGGPSFIHQTVRRRWMDDGGLMLGVSAARSRGTVEGCSRQGGRNVETAKRRDACDAGGAEAPRRLLLPLAAGHCSWRHLVAGIRGETGPSARNGPRNPGERWATAGPAIARRRRVNGVVRNLACTRDCVRGCTRPRASACPAIRGPTPAHPSSVMI